MSHKRKILDPSGKSSSRAGRDNRLARHLERSEGSGSEAVVEQWSNATIIPLFQHSNIPLLHRLRLCPRAVRLKLPEMFFRPTTERL
jgi:hypothetical protein